MRQKLRQHPKEEQWQDADPIDVSRSASAEFEHQDAGNPDGVFPQRFLWGDKSSPVDTAMLSELFWPQLAHA